MDAADDYSTRLVPPGADARLLGAAKDAEPRSFDVAPEEAQPFTKENEHEQEQKRD